VSSYRKGIGLSECEEALDELRTVIAEVWDLGGAPREHSEIEKHLERRMHDVARLILQHHFDRLAREEEKRDDVVDANGKKRRYARDRSRPLMTLHGEVQVNRLGYRDHGTGSIFPLDAQSNLPAERYSHGLRERVAEMVADGSYDGTVERIDRYTAGHVPKRQAEEMSRAAATDFDSFYRQRECRDERGSDTDQEEQKEEFLAMSMDGKGIVMRHEDLREQTQRLAEEERHKLTKRLSKGEKRNHKRMATVATVYDVAPHYRTAEDIIMAAKTDASRTQAPRPTNKRVWASVKRSPSQVADDVLSEARLRDPKGERTWVILVDGQEEQLRQVYAALKRNKAKAVVIQDFYHVTEYVWRAAWCLFEEGDPAAQKWVDTHLIDILRGKSSAVAAGMRRSATRRGLSKAERAPLDKSAGYLLKNRKRLRYDQALRKGMPIGTGVVEGACRHLVKQRMECSGARWSLEGAEAVLQLRALRMSGDWDEYWAYHCHHERLRNYPEYGRQLRLAA
jgi:hypothetical protein